VRRLPFLHPWLFLLASVVSLYAPARDTLPPVQLLRPLIVMALILLALSRAIRRITRDEFWTTMSLTMAVMAFFTSQRYALFLLSLIGLVAALWALTGLFVSRFRNRHLLSAALTLTAAALVAIHLGELLPPFFATPVAAFKRFLADDGGVPEPIARPGRARDVYFIVLDGYGRQDVLERYYGFDNSEFLAHLEQSGFIVPERSHSNYSRTATSIASALNMDYVQNLQPGLADIPFWWLMSPWIDRSRTRQILESAGYESVALGTDWDVTDNRTVPTYLSPYPIEPTDFERYLLRVTPLSLAVPFLGSAGDSYRVHRANLTYAFGELAQLAARPGPQFVFAHILAPHPPFVFDKEGNAISPKYGFTLADASGFPGTPEEYTLGYIEQLEYVNDQLSKTIAFLLANSPSQPVILLQADHGPGLFTDFARLELSCNQERFGAFAAYYLPGVDAALIAPDMTPVNLFRVVFNEYFGSSLELLPDRQFSYKSTVYIYDTVDVTASVDVACKIPSR